MTCGLGPAETTCRTLGHVGLVQMEHADAFWLSSTPPNLLGETFGYFLNPPWPALLTKRIFS